MRRFIRKDEDTKVVSKKGSNIVDKPDYRVSLQKFEEQLKNRIRSSLKSLDVVGPVGFAVVLVN